MPEKRRKYVPRLNELKEEQDRFGKMFIAEVVIPATFVIAIMMIIFVLYSPPK